MPISRVKKPPPPSMAPAEGPLSRRVHGGWLDGWMAAVRVLPRAIPFCCPLCTKFVTADDGMPGVEGGRCDVALRLALLASSPLYCTCMPGIR